MANDSRGPGTRSASAVWPLVALLSFAFAACGGDNNSTDPDPPGQAINYTLTVGRLEGATGTLTTGIASYPAGTQVSYAFQAAAGYDNLRVAIDSQSAPASGQLVMDRNRVLLAAAMPAKDLPSADPLLIATKALLTAPPATAFANYLSELSRMGETQSDSALRVRHRKAELMAFEPARDAAALRQLDDALAGKTFEIRNDGVSLVSAYSAEDAAAALVTREDATPTTVIYVNGILTTPSGAALSAAALSQLLRTRGIPTGDPTNSLGLGGGEALPVRFLFHYNPSVLDRWSVPEIRECLLGLALGAPRWLFGFVVPNTRIGQCPDLTGPVEVIAQWLSTNLGVGMNATIPLGVAGPLRAITDAERRTGRNVILVGHSQGNLLIQTALAGMPALTTNSSIGCISAVSIASPSGPSGWNSLEIPVEGTIAGDAVLGRQDILRSLPGSQFPPMSSSEIAYWAAWVNSFPFFLRGRLGIWADINLHFLDTYLKGDRTGAWIGDTMASQYQRLSTACGSTIAGQVISASDGAAVGGAQVEIKTRSGTTVGSVTADASGNFITSPLAAKTYQITATAANYISLQPSNVIVSPRSPTALGRIPLVRTSGGVGSATGTIRNARTLQAVPGARVDLRPGLNNFQGAVSYTTTSTSSGAYGLNQIAPGVFTATATASGYSPNARTIAVIGGAQSSSQDIELYPTAPINTIGIVLFWGSTPRDLDAHLTGPVAGTRFHVYWNNKGSLTGSPFAGLDVDDTTSFGPETITVTQQTAGVYRFSVHNYSDRSSTGDRSLSNSGAFVRLFLPGRNPTTFAVPNAAGNLWTVFELTGTQLTVINSMTDLADPSTVSARADATDSDRPLIKAVSAQAKSNQL